MWTTRLFLFTFFLFTFHLIPSCMTASVPITHLQSHTRHSFHTYAVNSTITSILHTRYDTSSSSLKMRDTVPRFGSSQPEATTGYMMGLAAYIIIGVGLALITLITFCCFCSCRLCCNGCGKAEPLDEGYSWKKRWLPYYFMCACYAGIIAASTLGFLANESFHNSFSYDETNGIPGIGQKLVKDTSNWLNTAQNNIGGITNSTDVAVNAVTPQLARTLSLSAGPSLVIAALNNFSSSYENTTISGYRCTYCATFPTRINDITTQINSQTHDIFVSLTNTVNAIQRDFVSVANQIKAGTNDASKSVADVQKEFTPQRQDDVNSGLKSANNYELMRYAALTAFLALPLIGVFLIACGGLTRNGTFFKVNYAFGYFVLFFFWILFGIHLLVGMAVGDGCVYVDNKMGDIQSVVSGNGGDAIAACLVGNSVLSALNVTSTLDFANTITFPSVPSINTSFNFAALNALQVQVQSLDYHEFGFNDSAIDDGIQQINSYKLPNNEYGTYARNNVSDVFPPHYGADATAVAALKDRVINALAIRAQIDSKLSTLKYDFNHVINITNTMQQNVTDAYNAINTMSTYLNPIIASANAFKRDADDCRFLANAFGNMKHAVCDNVLSQLSWLTLYTLIISLLSVATIWISTVLTKRVAHPESAFVVMYENKQQIVRNSAILPPINTGVLSSRQSDAGISSRKSDIGMASGRALASHRSDGTGSRKSIDIGLASRKSMDSKSATSSYKRNSVVPVNEPIHQPKVMPTVVRDEEDEEEEEVKSPSPAPITPAAAAEVEMTRADSPIKAKSPTPAIVFVDDDEEALISPQARSSMDGAAEGQAVASPSAATECSASPSEGIPSTPSAAPSSPSPVPADAASPTPKPATGNITFVDDDDE